MTLAFEDVNSNLLYVVSVADVYAEDRADDSLDKIVELRFGKDFEPEFWSRY